MKTVPVSTKLQAQTGCGLRGRTQLPGLGFQEGFLKLELGLEGDVAWGAWNRRKAGEARRELCLSGARDTMQQAPNTAA